MKKTFIISLTVLLGFLAIAYTIGYFNDGVNAILSNIPLLGEFLSFLDTCRLFVSISSDNPITFSNCANIFSLIFSIFVSFYTCSMLQDFGVIAKFCLGVLMSFFLTVMLKKLFIEGYLMFMQWGFNSMYDIIEHITKMI